MKCKCTKDGEEALKIKLSLNIAEEERGETEKEGEKKMTAMVVYGRAESRNL